MTADYCVSEVLKKTAATPTQRRKENGSSTKVKLLPDMSRAIFRQDESPAHHTKKTPNWCLANFRGFWGKGSWSGNSPDLSSIEYLWKIVMKSSACCRRPARRRSCSRTHKRHREVSRAILSTTRHVACRSAYDSVYNCWGTILAKKIMSLIQVFYLSMKMKQPRIRTVQGLQKVLNFGLRAVSGRRKQDLILDVWEELGWLTARQRLRSRSMVW